MKSGYNTAFYAELRDGSRESAKVVAPLLVDLLHPGSTLDVGCGTGDWVAELHSAGVAVAHGVDGPWVERSELAIPSRDFFPFDFSREAAPFRPVLARPGYDLVISFEFGEHIDEKLADPLVEFLTRTGDVVAFGAAAPFQGGTHHVNEQWPGYWSGKFKKHGYVACDIIRPLIWGNESVLPWYQQNSILYFRDEVPDPIAAAARSAWEKHIFDPISIAHPSIWSWRSSEARPTAANAARIINRLAKNTIKTLIGRK